MVYDYTKLEQGIYKIEIKTSLVNSEAIKFNCSIDELLRENSDPLGLILEFDKGIKSFASSSLGTIVALFKRLRDVKSYVVFSESPYKVLEILTRSGAGSYIETYESTDLAVDALKKKLPYSYGQSKSI